MTRPSSRTITPVGQPQREVRVLLNEQNCLALLTETVDHARDVLYQSRRQAQRRLIKQKQARLRDQCSRKC